MPDRHVVTLVVRTHCGSCRRVAEQIRPVVSQAGAGFELCNVDEDREAKLEFGDRVPVVLVDGEELGCWEIDNEDLAQALL